MLLPPPLFQGSSSLYYTLPLESPNNLSVLSKLIRTWVSISYLHSLLPHNQTQSQILLMKENIFGKSLSVLLGTWLLFQEWSRINAMAGGEDLQISWTRGSIQIGYPLPWESDLASLLHFSSHSCSVSRSLPKITEMHGAWTRSSHTPSFRKLLEISSRSSSLISYLCLRGLQILLSSQ